MVYCDNNERILEWGSEEMYVWYRSPIDNRPHRYFPDFYIKVKESTGTIKKYGKQQMNGVKIVDTSSKYLQRKN